MTSGKSSDALVPSVSIQHSNTALGQVSVITSSPSGSNLLHTTSGPVAVGTNPLGPVTVTSRRANNTSVTMINASNSNGNNNNNNSNPNHRISVFEPYPMRDTVQHFCEKHLDKIKAYMDNVSLRIPPPAKCTIEGKSLELLSRGH